MLDPALAYFNEAAVRRPAPASPERLAKADAEIEIRLPGSLREFYLAHDGLEAAGPIAYGVDALVRRTLEERESGPSEWLQEYLRVSEGPLGNPFFLDASERREGSPCIRFLVRGTGKTCVVASDLVHFLWFRIEMRKLRVNPDGTWKSPQPDVTPWPQDGGYVLRHDPRIEIWRDRGLPWEVDPDQFALAE